MTGYQSKKKAASARTIDEVNWLDHEPDGRRTAQEPWRESASDYERGFIDGMQKQMQSSVDKAVNRMAQRPWVDLTDEEMQAVVDAQLLVSNINVYFKAIEAKLKEKNNGT
jgi:hypothetical protein